MDKRKTFLTYILILVLPISTLVSADINTDSDCLHASQEKQLSTEEVSDNHDCHSTPKQTKHVIPSHTTAPDPCNCNSHLDCFSTVLSVLGITTDNKLILQHNHNQILAYQTRLLSPITVASLIRPPITIS